MFTTDSDATVGLHVLHQMCLDLIGLATLITNTISLITMKTHVCFQLSSGAESLFTLRTCLVFHLLLFLMYDRNVMFKAALQWITGSTNFTDVWSVTFVPIQVSIQNVLIAELLMAKVAFKIVSMFVKIMFPVEALSLKLLVTQFTRYFIISVTFLVKPKVC